MSQINTRIRSVRRVTHEGAPAKHITSEQELRRTLMACLLWEDTFYEDGVDVADRIAALIPKVDPLIVSKLAIEARTNMKLRHAPLLVAREMARLPKHRGLVSKTLFTVIQRADELTEFVSIYWKNKKEPLSAQVKKGLGMAFQKFSGYQLAKYNRDTAVKLRDVLFLCHAKPLNKGQAKVWKQLIDGTLPAPDTWEVKLSASVVEAVSKERDCSLVRAQIFIDKMSEVERKVYYLKIADAISQAKKKVWLKLLKDKELGALALIRNLRNMSEVNVPREKIVEGLEALDVSRVLPFRFISAARHNPSYEPEIEQAMFRCVAGQKKLKGRTVILIDVSGSMDAMISGKSEINRIDAASGLAILLREMCDVVDIFTFSDRTVRVPARRGFALRDAVQGSQEHSGTDLGGAIDHVNKLSYDRLIVVTDEQSQTAAGNPVKGKPAYMINIASYKNGVGYGSWTHLDGWSESLIEYIREIEG